MKTDDAEKSVIVAHLEDYRDLCRMTEDLRCRFLQLMQERGEDSELVQKETFTVKEACDEIRNALELVMREDTRRLDLMEQVLLYAPPLDLD